MNKPKMIRNKSMYILVNQSEYDQIMKLFSNSTCRSFSKYGRTVLLSEPVTVFYRNKSYDDFVNTIIQFRKKMDAFLSAGVLTESEKEIIFHDFAFIKEQIAKLYDYVRQDNTH
jgi:hypothetical protein